MREYIWGAVFLDLVAPMLAIVALGACGWYVTWRALHPSKWWRRP